MNLTLHLKKEYFDQIASGEKVEEYRLVTSYWQKRLIRRNYENIVLLCGYPKRGDMSRQIIRPWRGFTTKLIKHPHFGNQLVQVFAISVAPNNACTGQLAGEGKADGESTPSANCQ